MANEQQNQPSEQISEVGQAIHLEHAASRPLSNSDPFHEGNTSASSSVYASTPAGSNDGQPLWTHRLSASFIAVADQIAAASQAIAHIPPFPDAHNAHIHSRMEEIADKQEKLENELKELADRLLAVTEGPEKFQKQLDDHIAEFKLDQQRLPARLHNAIITVSKGAIKPVVDKAGKIPSQFPATRGEFEHLTKERYEGLMKAYGLPIAGDVAAKRNAVRAFIGLPQ